MKRWQALLATAVILSLLAVIIWLGWQPLMDFLGAQGDLLEGADAFLSILAALGAFTAAVFAFFSARKEKPASPPPANTEIKTGGGAFVGGNVNTGGGNFIGRDQTIKVGHDSLIIVGNVQHSMIVNTAEIADTLWRNTLSELSADALRQATAAYLQYLLDRHTYLTMKGIGPAENVPLRLELLDLYVPLKARRQLPPGETWERSLRLAGREADLRLSEPQPALEILKENDGLILLGDPGAGKTTFLKFLALKLARGEGAELGMGDRLPILLPLAAYAAALAERDARLDDFIARYFDEIGCDFPLGPMLAEALKSGRALILLDGLDEVKDLALRNTVVERVADFYTAHHRPGNKFVLTSRVVGYRAVRAAAAGLVECTLVDFEDEEIEAFITRWTSALEKQALGDTAVARRDAEQQRRELLTAMQTNEGVRRLAANPLLLTILALMKRQGVTLPERRVQLYDQYVRTLLSTWNRVRSLSGRAPSRDLDEVQTTRLLAPLALWMHTVNPGVGLVKRPDLERKLQEIFAERNAPDPEAAARQFLSDVREHAALLLERGPAEYGFIHLTFEEYLAAVALAFEAQGDPQPVVEALSRRIGEQAWREVSLLAVSYIGIIQNLPRVAGQVVEGLASAQNGAPAEAAVLAGEAALDALPDGITRQSAAKAIEALISAMQNPAAKPELRRRAGLALGKLGWTPADLDAFIQIQPGKFLYGENNEERKIEYPYWMAKYPVANLQFGRFIAAGGYDNPDWWSKDGWDWRAGKYETKAESIIKDWLAQRPPEQRSLPYYWDRAEWNNPIFPVVGVTWFEAQAYCRWLQEQMLANREPFVVNQDAEAFWAGLQQGSLQVRLPLELEWERAARFTDGRQYPWGNDFDPSLANTAESDTTGATAVCTYPPGKSREGIFDLSGNVWEWCADWYAKDKYRSLRGGSWGNFRRNARCAFRYRDIPVDFNNIVGFRCVVSLAISEF